MIQIGDSFSKTIVVTEKMVEDFAKVSGDYNPLHFDDSFASGTKFGKRIVHGMLLASFISSILANHLPGPGTVYVEQNLKFKAPIFIDDEVRVLVKCKDILKKSRYKFLTTVMTPEEVLAIDGEALVIVA